MQLQPQRNFTVVRQIGNHTDTGTYYVRAVIRNAYSDDILATLNLDDKGSLRFKKDWQVPADTLGEGYYVSIITSVYTDSGYTTKSENYSDEENTYLVVDHLNNRRGGFATGGSGTGVDAYTVRRIFREEFSKKDGIEEKSEDKKEEEDVEEVSEETPTEPARWEEVLQALQEVKGTLGTLPKDKVDLKPIFDAFQVIAEAIDDKEVTEKTDITPILDAISALGKETTQALDDMQGLIRNLEAVIMPAIDAGVKEAMATTNFVTSFVTHAAPSGKRVAPPEKEEEKPIDLKNLSL